MGMPAQPASSSNAGRAQVPSWAGCMGARSTEQSGCRLALGEASADNGRALQQGKSCAPCEADIATQLHMSSGPYWMSVACTAAGGATAGCRLRQQLLVQQPAHPCTYSCCLCPQALDRTSSSSRPTSSLQAQAGTGASGSVSQPKQQTRLNKTQQYPPPPMCVASLASCQWQPAGSRDRLGTRRHLLQAELVARGGGRAGGSLQVWRAGERVEGRPLHGDQKH